MRKAIRDGKLQADVHGLSIFQSLCALPTLFVEQDDLISQAFRQNVKSAYISPVSSLQWTHMVLVTHFGVAATWADAEGFLMLFCPFSRL